MNNKVETLHLVATLISPLLFILSGIVALQSVVAGLGLVAILWGVTVWRQNGLHDLDAKEDQDYMWREFVSGLDDEAVDQLPDSVVLNSSLSLADAYASIPQLTLFPKRKGSVVISIPSKILFGDKDWHNYVIYHEIGHIVQDQTPVNWQLVVEFVWFFLFPLYMAGFASVVEMPNSLIMQSGIVFVAIIVFLTVYNLFTSWFSRRLEYRADAFAMQYVDPDAGDRGLREYNRRSDKNVGDASWISRLFLEHPSKENRVQHMREVYNKNNKDTDAKENKNTSK